MSAECPSLAKNAGTEVAGIWSVVQCEIDVVSEMVGLEGCSGRIFAGRHRHVSSQTRTFSRHDQSVPLEGSSVGRRQLLGDVQCPFGDLGVRIYLAVLAYLAVSNPLSLAFKVLNKRCSACI